MWQKYESSVVENPICPSLGFYQSLYDLGAERVFRSLERKFENITLVSQTSKGNQWFTELVAKYSNGTELSTKSL